MSQHTDVLEKELEQFEKEKKQIRDLVGNIGGVQNSVLDRLLNIAFFTMILAIFGISTAQHFLHIEFLLSPIFSLEIGVMLVSLKIIWMIHRQTKVEHFQFWILNSIEFRLNEVARDVRQLRKYANEGGEERK
jgi:hypothetical protein